MDSPLYGQVPFLYVFQTLHFWQYLFEKIVQMKYRINTQKNSQEKVISSKQYHMSFIRNTFISNTG